METYALVDNVKSLPHSLTPHVTIAYYHINGLPAEQVGKLKKTVAELNETPHDFILDNERLYYQTFTSMKDYRIVFPLIKGVEYENTF